MICLLDPKICSGKRIEAANADGFAKYWLKWFKWTSKRFWKEDATMLRNNYFTDILDANIDASTGVYKVEGVPISLKSALSLTQGQMRDLLYNKKSVKLEIADDLFVKSPRLQIVYKLMRP